MIVEKESEGRGVRAESRIAAVAMAHAVAALLQMLLPWRHRCPSETSAVDIVSEELWPGVRTGRLPMKSSRVVSVFEVEVPCSVCRRSVRFQHWLRAPVHSPNQSPEPTAGLRPDAAHL